MSSDHDQHHSLEATLDLVTGTDGVLDATQNLFSERLLVTPQPDFYADLLAVLPRHQQAVNDQLSALLTSENK